LDEDNNSTNIDMKKGGGGGGKGGHWARANGLLKIISHVQFCEALQD